MSFLLWAEMLVVFVLTPMSLYAVSHHLHFWLMPMLFVVGIMCLAVLLFDNQFKRGRLWNTRGLTEHVIASVRLFVPWACLITAGVWWFLPEHLFDLPLAHTQLWISTLLIYPIVSVLPQEIIFRTFFFHRYKNILPQRRHRWWLSSFLFGLAHLVYGNWIAVAGSWFAGLVFGYRYMQSKSTLAVAFEHTLWGSFIFTVGFGAFFLTTQY